MDSQVSAYSVYKQYLPKQAREAKRRIRKKKAAKAKLRASVKIPEEIVKKASLKLQKSKKNKLNGVKNKTIVKKTNRTKKISTKTEKRQREERQPEETVPEVIAQIPEVTFDDGLDLTPERGNSATEGYRLFQWMVDPLDVNEFFRDIWEKSPIRITRNKPKYYEALMSTALIDDMLRKETIQFTKNIDITTYSNGKRETHNPTGRAHPHVVWDYYLNGCSIRLLNPQTYLPVLHTFNSTLQEFTNSFVGANAYLTPPDSQGFAPHYDDIEAFVLQIEGKKHWKVYKPLSPNEVLPRESSRNFEQHEIGEPILEVTLQAGDLLYFPRGFIHQGVTIEGEHSLHITVSMYQKHSWADLLEKMIPAALQTAITEKVDLRMGLPQDIYDHLGLVHSHKRSDRRKTIMRKILSLFDKIKYFLPFDDAVDQIAKNYQRDALPPVLSDMEQLVTVYGCSDVMAEGKVTSRVEIEIDTRIRLLRKNILRMVMEDGIKLYYYNENSLEYHGNDQQLLEIDEDMAQGVETLIHSYPEYVSVENLNVPNDSEKVQLANDLWERGIIMTEYPMGEIDDD